MNIPLRLSPANEAAPLALPAPYHDAGAAPKVKSSLRLASISILLFVLAFAGLAYSLFPYLVIDRITLWDAAAATGSLKIMLVGAAVTLPMILVYTVYVYRVFWGRSAELSYE